MGICQMFCASKISKHFKFTQEKHMNPKEQQFFLGKPSLSDWHEYTLIGCWSDKKQQIKHKLYKVSKRVNFGFVLKKKLLKLILGVSNPGFAGHFLFKGLLTPACEARNNHGENKQEALIYFRASPHPIPCTYCLLMDFYLIVGQWWLISGMFRPKSKGPITFCKQIFFCQTL